MARKSGSKSLQLGKSPNGLISLSKNGKYYRANLNKISNQFVGKAIYIPLGIEAIEENRMEALTRIAELEKKIKTDLDSGCLDTTFDKYKAKPTKEERKVIGTVREYLEGADKPYFKTRPRTDQKLCTLENRKRVLERHYRPYMDSQLNCELIYKVLMGIPIDSYYRDRITADTRWLCQLFPDLNEMIFVQRFDWKQFKSTYETKERKLPTDEEVIEGFRKVVEIKEHDERWSSSRKSYGWAYGIIATYGIRSHELKAIDIDASFNDQSNMLVINPDLSDGTKTGGRVVFPILREWVDLFGLKDIKRSESDRCELTSVFAGKLTRSLEGNTVKTVCSVISRRMRERGLWFRPYDMRHAYAIRGWRLGFKMQDLAKFMGHTLKTHESTYQKYMDAETKAEVYTSTYELYEEKVRILDKRKGYDVLFAENVELKLEVEKLKAQIQELTNQ